MKAWSTTAAHELPPAREQLLKKALRLEWSSLVYFSTAIAFTAVVMGQSQAMKTAWFDDMLGLIPPLAVIIAARVRQRRPDAHHPYGFHRSVSIAFLVGAAALLALGLVLTLDGVQTLARGEHPTIAGIDLLGHQVWLGWPMIAALLYSTVPTIFLGRVKVKLAAALHDKALHADATMNADDWRSGAAAIVGVLGLGLGWWWADAVAAILIALDIVHDGVTSLRTVIGDLMDRCPRDVADHHFDPLPGALQQAIEQLPWVRGAAVRLRECGHVFFGEAFVLPHDEHDPLARVREVQKLAYALDWRLHDLTVQLVDRPEPDPRA